MNLKDLLEQLVCGRIEMLLNGRSDEVVQEEERLNSRLEEIIERLNKEEQAAIEQFLDDWIALFAEVGQYLYVAGIKDGVRLFKVISGI